MVVGMTHFKNDVEKYGGPGRTWTYDQWIMRALLALLIYNYQLVTSALKIW